MTILALLQSHTGNSYFHNYIVEKAEILFWRGRIRLGLGFLGELAEDLNRD